MESGEPPRIVALGASGRISRREVIARPTTPGFTSGPCTTLNPHPDTGPWDSSAPRIESVRNKNLDVAQNLTLFCRETRNIVDWRRTA